MGKSKITGKGFFRINGTDRDLHVLEGETVEAGDFITYKTTAQAYQKCSARIEQVFTGISFYTDYVWLPDGNLVVAFNYYGGSYGHHANIGLIEFDGAGIPSLAGHTSVHVADFDMLCKVELLANGDILVITTNPPNQYSGYKSTNAFIFGIDGATFTQKAYKQILFSEDHNKETSTGLLVLDDTHFMVSVFDKVIMCNISGGEIVVMSTNDYVLPGSLLPADLIRLDDAHVLSLNYHCYVLTIGANWSVSAGTSITLSGRRTPYLRLDARKFLISDAEALRVLTIDDTYNMSVSDPVSENIGYVDCFEFDESTDILRAWGESYTLLRRVGDTFATLASGSNPSGGWVIPKEDGSLMTISLQNIYNDGLYFVYGIYKDGVITGTDNIYGVSLRKGTKKIKATCIR